MHIFTDTHVNLVLTQWLTQQQVLPPLYSAPAWYGPLSVTVDSDLTDTESSDIIFLGNMSESLDNSTRLAPNAWSGLLELRLDGKNREFPLNQFPLLVEALACNVV